MADYKELESIQKFDILSYNIYYRVHNDNCTMIIT